MNEKQKVNADKGSLPPKTKTVVKWLITAGIVMPIMIIAFSCVIRAIEAPTSTTPYLAIGILFLLCVLPAILVCIKNRITWILAIIILSGYLAWASVYMLQDIISTAKGPYFDPGELIPSVLPFLIMLIPLILLIIDRKNYFEMLRQRKSDKELQL